MSRGFLLPSKSVWRGMVINKRDFILSACALPTLVHLSSLELETTSWASESREQTWKENTDWLFPILNEKQNQKPPTELKLNIFHLIFCLSPQADTFILLLVWSCRYFVSEFSWSHLESGIIICGILLGATSDFLYQALLDLWISAFLQIRDF